MVLDIKVIREDPDRVRAGALLKGFSDRVEAVDRALAVDAELRELIPRLDELRSQQKKAAKAIGRLSVEERARHLEEQKELKARIQEIEERERELRARLRAELLRIPNVPDPEVPEGEDESANVEIRRWGEIRRPDFGLRSHEDLAAAQGWLDTERAARIAGSRNYFLLGDLALLQEAVLRFATEHMVAKGFTPVDPPVLVRDEAMIGTAFFPGGEEQTYRCEKDGLNLIGTSEVPVTALHGGEILDEADLPRRYVARSVCFRREAGTYGRDTRGLYRVHQFHKVEQVIVDVADVERSKQHQRDIVRNSEELLEALELPYRVVLVCGGDLGVPQVLKYDIECWMPSRGAFGETHSASRFHDYQARRLGLRYRRRENRKTAYCHTLNNTVVASPRILIPLLEVHQQPDGTVRVPGPLVPYLGGREILGRPL